MTSMEVPPKIAFARTSKKNIIEVNTKVQSTFDIIDYLLALFSTGGKHLKMADGIAADFRQTLKLKLLNCSITLARGPLTLFSKFQSLLERG
jgi:hypothetical protein